MRNWAMVVGLVALAISGVTVPRAGIAAHRGSQAINLQAIHMVTALEGWAEGDRSLWHTADGGGTWRNVTPPKGSTDVYGLYGLVSASYLTGRMAWLVVGPTTILRTCDGGQTWVAITVYLVRYVQFLVQLTFIDPHHGWALASSDDAAGSTPVQVMATGDGGAHWRTISATNVTADDTPGGLPFGGAKNGLGFRDVLTGFATGSTVASEGLVLYVTHDGGRTWRYHALAFPAGWRRSALMTSPPRFFTPRDGILPASLFSYAGNSLHLVFYATHDGGQTWAAGALLPANVATSFVDATHGWALSGRQLYVTHDSARHWTPFASNLPARVAGTTNNALNFVNARVGFASSTTPGGQSSLFKTQDGGHVWAIMHPHT